MSEQTGYASSCSDVLQSQVRSADVVIFRTALTDTRPILQRLKESETPYREIVMGMSDAKMRERFYDLSAMTGWKTLPQIFVDGRFVGGEQEFLGGDHANSGDYAESGQGERSTQPVASLARVIGYSGLLPFIGLTLYLLLPGKGNLDGVTGRLLLGYGAVILSFIGAIHWGAALKLPSGTPVVRPELIVSVIPALAGWVSLGLVTTLAYSVQVTAFASVYLYEHFTAHRRLFPPWYLALRRRLTVLVVACLVAGAYATSGYEINDADGALLPSTEGSNLELKVNGGERFLL